MYWEGERGQDLAAEGEGGLGWGLEDEEVCRAGKGVRYVLQHNLYIKLVFNF